MVEVSSAVVADSPDHALCREAQQVGLMLLKVLQQRTHSGVATGKTRARPLNHQLGDVKLKELSMWW
jgi:hypothetical protein